MSEESHKKRLSSPAARDLEEKVLQRIPWEIILVAGLMALFAAFLFGLSAGLFCFVGGVISALGFFWLRESLTRFLSRDRPRLLRSIMGLYLLRLGLIGLIFLLIIYFFSRKALAFIAGFSALVVVFLGEAAIALKRMKSWKV